MAFGVEGGPRRVGFRREAGGRRQRALDFVEAEQAGRVRAQQGGAPAGGRGHVHGVQGHPEHVRE